MEISGKKDKYMITGVGERNGVVRLNKCQTLFCRVIGQCWCFCRIVVYEVPTKHFVFFAFHLRKLSKSRLRRGLLGGFKNGLNSNFALLIHNSF